MLMTLPWQVFSVIAAYSAQSGVVSLLVAQPSLAPILLPRLYRSLKIDVGKRAIDDTSDEQFTVVRTTRGLRKVLQVLGNNCHLAQYVRRLEVKSNIPISDLVMKRLLSAAFTNLSGLEALYWSACPELSLHIFGLLPHPEQLIELVADLAIRPGQIYMPVNLSSLRVLKIQPFVDEECLEWLRAATQGACLETLSLSRDLKKPEVGSGYAFVGFQQAQSVPLESFFRRNELYSKWQLRDLKLQGFACNNDQNALLEAIDIKGIECLSLSGEDCHGTLLRELTGNLTALKSLEMKWNAPQSSMCKFLESLSISRLSVHIHNDAKEVLAVVSNLPLTHLEIKGECLPSALAPIYQLSLESLALPFDLSQSWPIAKQFKTLKTLSLSPSRSLCDEMSWHWLTGELKGVKIDVA